MKKLTILLFVVSPFLLLGQAAGKITYQIEVKIELPPEMKDKPEMQSIVAQMPKSMKSEKELIYFGDKSIYKNVEKDEATNERSGFMYSYKRPDEQHYLDLETEENIHLTDFFGKTFLISGEYEKRTWKVTKDQKMVNDYLCFKAISGDSTDKVMVWFTPQILTSAAPMYLNGLPGLILEASMNEGKTIMTLKDMELEGIKETDIEKPTKGKKITKEKYEILREKKRKEMKEQYGGRGNRIIISN